MRMIEASEDDRLYEPAVRDVVNQPATSLDGIQAKFERLSVFLDGMQSGETPTELGRIEIKALQHGIKDAIARIIADRRTN